MTQYSLMPNCVAKQQLPITFTNYSGFAINNVGLVVNNMANVEGRDSYFPAQSGTSEGQLLLLLGLAAIRKATGDIQWDGILNIVESGTDRIFQTNALTHWLFAVKGGFLQEKPNYSTIINFVDGVGTIPTSLGGAYVRNVYHARTLDSSYLWQNPYSVLTAGTKYEIASVVYNETDTVVTLSTAITGDLYLMYTTKDGAVITKNSMFEAWPYWRELDVGEFSVAMDSLVWSLQTYTKLNELKPSQVYVDRLSAIESQVLYTYSTDDGRAWIRQRNMHPLDVPGSSKYTEVSGFTVSRSSNGGVSMSVSPVPSHGGAAIAFINSPTWLPPFPQTVPPSVAPLVASDWTSEVQYSMGVSEVLVSGVSISFDIYSDRVMQARIFVDTSITYDSMTRYFYYINLAQGSNVGQINSGLFINEPLYSEIPDPNDPNAPPTVTTPPATSLPVGSTLYNVGLSVIGCHKATVSPFELIINSIRPLPKTYLPYVPDICPFTSNFFNYELIDWRGDAYAGYQYPTVWDYVAGEQTRASGAMTFLQDAQAAYTASTGLVGAFAPVYNFDKWDSANPSNPDVFSWIGDDPNTHWEGYQYRPACDVALYLYNHPTNIQALDIITKFLNLIDTYWVTGIPSDFREGVPPQSNYFTLHGVALMLRACLYLELSGNSTASSISIKSKCLNELSTRYSGGLFTDLPDFYPFWYGELLNTFSLMKENPATIPAGFTLDTYIDGVRQFLYSVIEQ